MIALMMLSSFYSYSQKNFTWEKIDSVEKTKDEIYSDTKFFIAEKWKSSKEVIQNDDKENGIIIIKGTIKEISNNGLTFWYSYTIKILMKDFKYKIIVDNVKYSSSDCNGSFLILEPQEEYPGTSKSCLFKKNWIELMESLKKDLEEIIISYDKHIKTNSTNSNW
jgi:hypothetical protein